MDSDRFDELSKQLARPRSRRETLGLFGAAVAGLVFGKSATAAPKADKPTKCYGGGSSCTNAKQCCSGVCTNRQCAPEIPPECIGAGDCTNAVTECQVRTCTAGVCGTSNLASHTLCSTGVCDGNGQCVGCVTGTDCTSGLCENNVCSPTCRTNTLLGTECTAGLGACIRSGVYVCAADGIAVVCNAVAGTNSSPEICNGIDDDCDGTVDNNAYCPPLFSATTKCVNGACVLDACYPGSGNCNGDPTDGCETNLLTDVNNCGACNHRCSYPNASSVCANGNCVLGSCNPGFVNCNGNPADGCETNILADVNNCGACGHVCSLPHATSVCVNGNCVPQTCDPGYTNCNGNPADGCECPSSAMCDSGFCCVPDNQRIVFGIPCCAGFSYLGVCGAEPEPPL